VEEDTAAATMPGQVLDAVKRERLETLLDLQRTITQENNEARIGRVVPVLIDRLTGRESALLRRGAAQGAIGRTPGQALEIDGVVHIANGAGLRPGRFANVQLSEAIEHDLVGHTSPASP
jgi:ribosomal protein S12 methylthiotransferase